jgi:hypothetical protein
VVVAVGGTRRDEVGRHREEEKADEAEARHDGVDAPEVKTARATLSGPRIPQSSAVVLPEFKPNYQHYWNQYFN